MTGLIKNMISHADDDDLMHYDRPHYLGTVCLS
jgi:hypothetical protein